VPCSPRVPSSDVFERRPVVRAERFRMGRHPKTFTLAEQRPSTRWATSCLAVLLRAVCGPPDSRRCPAVYSFFEGHSCVPSLSEGGGAEGVNLGLLTTLMGGGAEGQSRRAKRTRTAPFGATFCVQIWSGRGHACISVQIISRVKLHNSVTCRHRILDGITNS
jgi:hypothetical protein